MKHVPAQAVEVSSTALSEIMSVAIHRLVLLMSVDLLYKLECQEEYEQLYQRLKLFEKEGLLFVAALRACPWEWSFTAQALPTGDSTIMNLAPAKRIKLYKEIAAHVASM
jgi:hypothetical protein